MGWFVQLAGLGRAAVAAQNAHLSVNAMLSHSLHIAETKRSHSMNSRPASNIGGSRGGGGGGGCSRRKWMKAMHSQW